MPDKREPGYREFDNIDNPGEVLLPTTVRDSLTNHILNRFYETTLLDNFPSHIIISTRLAAHNALNEGGLPPFSLLDVFGGFPFKEADSVSIEIGKTDSDIDLKIQLFKTPDINGRHIIHQDYTIETSDDYPNLFEVRRVNPEHCKKVALPTIEDEYCRIVSDDDVAALLDCVAPKLADIHPSQIFIEDSVESNRARIMGAAYALKDSAKNFVKVTTYESEDEGCILEHSFKYEEKFGKVNNTEYFTLRRRIPESVILEQYGEVPVWLDFSFTFELDESGNRNYSEAQIDFTPQDESITLDRHTRPRALLDLATISPDDFQKLVNDGISYIFDPYYYSDD